MKINHIKINGFGKLKDKEINLENGINLICGNEVFAITQTTSTDINSGV